MSVFKIAWRTIQHRGVGSVLTVLSMALGVMMVVLVITIHGVVEQSFKSNSSFGYDQIVGSRGGSLQLTANTVYYLSKPVENIPYEYYLAFKNQEVRQREMQHSYAAKAALAQRASQELNGVLMSAMGSGIGAPDIANALIDDAQSLALDYQMDINRDGKYASYVETAVPICMGDYLDFSGKFRVCATTPQFFTDLVLDADTEEKFEPADGRFFETNSSENGFFEAVIGSAVARERGLKVGDNINPVHGDPSEEGAHIHEQGFKIVGVLKRTGTPHDRAAFVNMEGFFLMDGHANIVEAEAPEADESDDDQSEPDEFNASTNAVGENIRPVSFSANARQSENQPTKSRASSIQPLPIEEREVTAVLIRSAGYEGFSFGANLAAVIGEGGLLSTLEWSDFRDSAAQTSAQGVNPIGEIYGLFATFVNPVRYVLLALTFIIVVVSAISILVGIYSSMAQRKREIAIMRALGAGKDTVVCVMFFEAVILTMAGAIFGVFAGHLVMQIVSPVIESRTGVSVGFFDIAPPIWQVRNATGIVADVLNFLLSGEVIFVFGLFLLSLIVGVSPAITAYRTDVSRSLTE
jgi:putative ABC transport system permease protein